MQCTRAKVDDFTNKLKTPFVPNKDNAKIVNSGKLLVQIKYL